MTFTQDDQLNPVYCIGCRAHIPRAVSNANRGLCPTCLAKIGPAAPPQAQPQPVPQAQAQPQASWLHRLNTLFVPKPRNPAPNGLCPRCASPNILVQYVRTPVSNGLSGSGCALIVVGLCIPFVWIVGIILLIVGMFSPSSQVVGAHRHCGSCGLAF